MIKTGAHGTHKGHVSWTVELNIKMPFEMVKWQYNTTNWIFSIRFILCFAMRTSQIEKQRQSLERERKWNSFIIACNLKRNTWIPLLFGYMLNGFYSVHCKRATILIVTFGMKRQKIIWLGSKYSFTMPGSLSSWKNAVRLALRNHAVIKDISIKIHFIGYSINFINQLKKCWTQLTMRLIRNNNDCNAYS